MKKSIIFFPLMLLNLVMMPIGGQLPEKYLATHSTTNKAYLLTKVAPVVQHFACISYNLVANTVKNKSTNESLSRSEKPIVQMVEKTYAQEVEKARALIFNSDPSEQKKALPVFGNYILKLCNDCGVYKNYVQRFPSHLSNTETVKAHYAIIEAAVAALEKRFDTIKPVAPLSMRIANVLFYNVVSTKIIPKAISYAVGPAVALLWAASKYNVYSKNVAYHPHLNVLKDYVPVEHDTKISWKKEPSMLEGFFGIESSGAEFIPCEIRFEGNFCNGLQDPNKTKPRQKDEQLLGLARGAARGLMNGGGISPVELEEEPVRWASRCPVRHEGEPCYHYRGFKSPEKIAALLVGKAIPIGAILLTCHMIGKAMEDAQIHEYEQRKKEQQKKEQAKKIEAEMKRMKVNYERSIGFTDIKGHTDLIDKEGRLLVDYLKNPLRYKNNTGTRSVLFYGPPGTGKTLMARAIAKESGAPFLEITADDILDDQGKEKIIATMKLAEEVALKRPEKSAIIYIDEIDCVTGNRQNGTLDPQRAKALSNLLSIFDGIEKRNPFVHILIVITTNHYKNLDAALLRPGRIDRKILITPPNAAGRGEFFDALLPERDKEYREWLVEQTDGFNGAQIVNIVDTAQMIASYAGRPHPSKKDYQAALQNSKQENNEMPESVQEL